MKNADARIIVFIPAYRCAAQIVRVLRQFSPEVQGLVDTVMVVDNQSPDETLEVAVEVGKAQFKDCKFIAWRNRDNYGLGGSHKAAIRYALDNGYTHLVVLHGDDQAHIADLVPYLRNGDYRQFDCFLGARFMRGSQLRGYSWFRTFGNKVYNLLFSAVVMRPVKDLGSGLNLYRLEALRDFYYKGFPDDLTFNYMMLLASYHRGQKVGFFPISWREEDQVSNVKMFRQAVRVLYLLAGYGIRRGSFLAKDVRRTAFEEYTGDIVHEQKAGGKLTSEIEREALN